MGTIVPAGGNPYPRISDIMNTARSRVNDMINDVDGDLLTNDAPYAQTYLSDAWTWYQDRCADVGVETLIKEVVLQGLPATASRDTADQAWLTWLGCSDGVNQFDLPQLPQDLIQPLSIWRRQTQTTNAFALMRQAEDGLPIGRDPNVFDWRDDGVYFYAPTFAQDFRIRYAAYRADLNVLVPTMFVPMMRCRDCLGARVAFEYASARGSAQAPAMEAWAESAFMNGAATRTSRRKQRQTLRRRPYSGGRRGGWGFWPVPGN
jgi:hypothetical protein